LDLPGSFVWEASEPSKSYFFPLEMKKEAIDHFAVTLHDKKVFFYLAARDGLTEFLTNKIKSKVKK
jgi:hypothetical protein